MRIAVIGSGISGLSIANLLKDDHKVVVYEKNNLAGGLIKCERVNDCLFHKVGGHVFNSRNQKVLDWFWSYFDQSTEFVKAVRNAKVYYNEQIIGYPIENFLYHLEKENTSKIIDELLSLQKIGAKDPFDYESFEHFLIGTFGQTLYDLYFKPYNNKIWRTDLSTVSMQWLEGKLPMPQLSEIIKSNIFREEENSMVHSTFFYPKENGSQFIVDRLKRGLTIITDGMVDEVIFDDGFKLIKGEQFDKVVYCGDIRKMPASFDSLLSEAGVDLDYIRNLRSNGTSNLFCETDDNDISWLYIPQDFTRAHRIIYTGNFSETNNRGSSRKTCVVEFSGKLTYEEMLSEIRHLPGNLVPISSNYEPNSYVVQDHYTRAVVNNVKRILESKGVFLLGRFAEWEYYNMDKAIEAAFQVQDKLN
ncbi:MAG: UDP-galactopyranose mutase [Pedobacter sp.]|nr:MAG: UDP-galactopyranose mutase [Pedobacter sp.]